MNPEPHIVTLGCRLNLYESEVIRNHARAAGLDDVVIINSCAVTGEAERQTRQAIRKARRDSPSAFLILTGCAAHIHPEQFESMPEVDAVIPNTDKLKADVYFALKEKRVWESRTGEDALYEAPLVHGFEGKTRAFVQIQNGCNNACTFCIIPQGRGKSLSVAAERIVDQVRTLAPHYPEITLTGVDIASYDLDGMRLGGLVKKLLAEVPELRRLRLSSLDPAALDEGLWDALASQERLMPCLHLSVQAGDDMVLKRMKRRHCRQDVYDIVARARELRPDIVFGADVIAGFPTEDEAMFENGYRLFEELDFTWLHVFPYSPREGTPAARMPQVENKIRKIRAARLRELGDQAVQRHLESLVSQELLVHVEKETLGRTPTFAEIVLDKPQVPATVVNVRVSGVEGQRAIGEVLG